MRNIIILFISILFALPCKAVDLEQLAKKISEKSQGYVDIEDYKGSVYLQGLSAMSEVAHDDYFQTTLTAYLDRFLNNDIKGYGTFHSYVTGGTALAEQAFLHNSAAYKKVVAETASTMWTQLHHTTDGMLLPRWQEVMERNGLFADCAFPVCSYYVYAGLQENNNDYLDAAATMALAVYANLYDNETGLIHQARAISRLKEGELSQDCWSRGNGWLALSLGYLLDNLPKTNKYRSEVENVSRKFFTAVMRYQDANGMWHQEMTWTDSYPEVSGSALLLYGIASAIQSKVLPLSARKSFEKGIRGMLRYIDNDGNIGNTCSGCLAYLNATKADYASHQYYTNEAHAFGTTLLAIAKAISLGYRKISNVRDMGKELQGRIPRCYARCITERKNDFAWENDKIAFRIYSHIVPNKGFSGVDLWTKSVDYPIVDKWYAENAKEDGAYHIDKGEGYDFYHMGANRGIGGTGVVIGNTLAVADTYSDCLIVENSPKRVEFVISYPPYPAGEDTIYETKRCWMELGTYFYNVESTVRTASGRDVIYAVGLTEFGYGEVNCDPHQGYLSLLEKISDNDGTIGSAIIASPQSVVTYRKIDRDHLMCFNLKSGSRIHYRVGAGWSKDLRFDPIETKWLKTVLAETKVKTITKTKAEAKTKTTTTPDGSPSGITLKTTNMKTNYELRYASNPVDAKHYDTDRLRKEYHIENIFAADEVNMTYTMHDRMIVGGAMPVNEPLPLEAIDPIKADYFLSRREIGIFNVGGKGVIDVDGTTYALDFKEALYLGRGNRNVTFRSIDASSPARFYFCSATAHTTYPDRKVTKADAEAADAVIKLGSMEGSNDRVINRMLVHQVLPTCQLQMGMTELQPGSVWNTMPAHTHSRRMEAYFYFDLPADQAVCHFMGEPQETRVIWMQNNQAVISPEWSIHSAAATHNYTFIWSMCGENLDYSDQDWYKETELK